MMIIIITEDTEFSNYKAAGKSPSFNNKYPNNVNKTNWYSISLNALCICIMKYIYKLKLQPIFMTIVLNGMLVAMF